jgi:hypothetical protein
VSDETKTRSTDSERISPKSSKEVCNWAKLLGVTPAGLKEAVKTVGTSAKKVREYLAKK